MMENVSGLSLDLLVHPGETIKEAIEDRNMSQEELALRTNYSAKHISEVVRGKKDISSEFANALEYALDIPSSFWMNLQNNYDKQVIEIKNINSIAEEEFDILKQLSEVLKFCEDSHIIEPSSKKEVSILNLRRFLNVNNLASISSLPIVQAAFRASKKDKTNVYVLYSWQKICELYSKQVKLSNNYNLEKLKEKFKEIKSTMFLPANEMVKRLQNIFSECGIVFEVVKNFTGAPVQGFIQKKDDKVVLCMTIRKKFTDIFWFTLFHEIGHLINGDFSDKYIDYQFSDSDEETKADTFAQNILIDPDDYNNFFKKGCFNEKDIIDFAREQGIVPGIVVGRIQRDINDYTFLYNLRERYEWS